MGVQQRVEGSHCHFSTLVARRALQVLETATLQSLGLKVTGPADPKPLNHFLIRYAKLWHPKRGLPAFSTTGAQFPWLESAGTAVPFENIRG
jgi:hypothetical protein